MYSRYWPRVALLEEAGMSARNGDKARYQKNRKRAVMRRSKMREMAFYHREAVEAVAKERGAAADAPPKGAPSTES